MAGLPHGVSGGRWPNGCLAPAIQLAEMVLARQRPRFYGWLLRHGEELCLGGGFSAPTDCDLRKPSLPKPI